MSRLKNMSKYLPYVCPTLDTYSFPWMVGDDHAKQAQAKLISGKSIHWLQSI